MPAVAIASVAVSAYGAYSAGKEADKNRQAQIDAQRMADQRSQENLQYWKDYAQPGLDQTKREITANQPLDYGLLSGEADRNYGDYSRALTSQGYTQGSGLTNALRMSALYNLGSTKAQLYGQGMAKLRDERDRFSALAGSGVAGTQNNYVSSLHDLSNTYGRVADNYQGLGVGAGQFLGNALGAYARYRAMQPPGAATPAAVPLDTSDNGAVLDQPWGSGSSLYGQGGLGSDGGGGDNWFSGLESYQ